MKEWCVSAGLFPASSGTALINGYDIGTEVDEVRASLGICPQHDVLFDELTVAEHIRFFCMVRVVIWHSVCVCVTLAIKTCSRYL